MIDFRHLLSTREPKFWQRLVRGLLIPWALPYWLVASLKNWLYEQGGKEAFSSPLSTISVGNLSVGGTGKSPMVAWVARQIRSRDVRVAILSRGYGQLDDGRNDEALELELTLPDVPHLQNPDRVASAKLAEDELQMQALVLDDGFQHRRIARDLEIVLLDASEHPRTRHVLPWGLLRESIRGLSRADVIVLTRCDQAVPCELERLESTVARIAKREPLLLRANHEPSSLVTHGGERIPCSALEGKRILAFCGIGRPDSFILTLESLGATVLQSRAWPDHHAYDRSDIEDLSQWASSAQKVDYVVCTLKDLVKIRLDAVGAVPLVALAIEIRFAGEGEESLMRTIDDCIKAKSASSERQSE
ncbi:MAG: tetraacyldisaccharide 4'-kinase [Planctomycetota bacterium]